MAIDVYSIIRMIDRTDKKEVSRGNR
jgi:hypothetical protein